MEQKDLSGQQAGEGNKVLKYVKKPIATEAIQWDGTYNGMKNIQAVFNDLPTNSSSYHEANNTVTTWRIKTLEGARYVSANDFIIKGIGEYSLCKPDVFEITYEPASPPSNSGEVKEQVVEDWKYQAKALSAIKKGLEVALKDAIEECERMAKVAEYWQTEYYKLNPPIQPGKLDNL